MKTITILVLGTSILASGPFSESEDELVFSDITFPKHVIAGYEIHQIQIQEDESIRDFTWSDTGLIKIITTPTLPTEAEYVAAVDRFLQAGAAIRTYDNIINASLRAGYPGPFHDEGVQYATWMDDVWAFGYTLLAQVKTGKFAQPTVDEFIAMLPVCPVTPRV